MKRRLTVILLRVVAACSALCAGAAAAGAQTKGGAVSGFAEVNGTRLYYEAAGRGPAVVLLHGGLNDSRLWDAQMGPLSKRFRVVRYDLRGFGRSNAERVEFWPTEDLRALLDFLKIKRATLVGLSLGGIVAADFALEHPERVERLVLVGSGLRGGGFRPDEKASAARLVGEREGAERYFEAFLQSDLLAGLRTRPKAREAMRRMMVENYKANAYVSAGFSQSPEPPTAERLGLIKAPALVLVGALDAPALLDIADTLAAKIPGARKVTIPGASHHPPVETPREFNRALLDFLTKR
ncbi:MAG TPA: alpha/beta fold hydrolase [Pyrinomonadaceae bacterium]|jgi:pimeloyl-ACP methyl ester carboxylesterase